MTQLPNKVGVLGGGRMGGGIAHAFLINGSHVHVVERDETAAAAARERIDASVAKSIERGLVDVNLDVVTQRLSVSVDRKDFADCQLVVEAVPEDFELKVNTLQIVEGFVPESTYIASNTSSLSVDKIGAQLKRPEKFVGLHFFNPVPASKLIEVVIGEKTDPTLADAAKGWVEALGKTAVVVKDAPGFASSRLGVAIALEAMRMVEEGVASAEDIDNAMVLGYGHAAGPLKTTDIVGLDVRLGISEYLHSTLGERFAPPEILKDMVARGQLGRKSGKGFYDWS